MRAASRRSSILAFVQDPIKALWQVDQMPTYDIAVSRSFAGSFWHWLETSAATVGFAVTDPMD